MQSLQMSHVLWKYALKFISFLLNVWHLSFTAFQFRRGFKLHMKQFDHMRCEICKEKFQDYNTLKKHQKKCKRESNDGM